MQQGQPRLGKLSTQPSSSKTTAVVEAPFTSLCVCKSHCRTRKNSYNGNTAAKQPTLREPSARETCTRNVNIISEAQPHMSRSSQKPLTNSHESPVFQHLPRLLPMPPPHPAPHPGSESLHGGSSSFLETLFPRGSRQLFFY